jgi:hypothetical protein
VLIFFFPHFFFRFQDRRKPREHTSVAITSCPGRAWRCCGVLLSTSASKVAERSICGGFLGLFFCRGCPGGLRVLQKVFLPLFVSIVSLFVTESDSRVVFVVLRV